MSPRIIPRPEAALSLPPFRRGWRSGLAVLARHGGAFWRHPLRMLASMGILALSLILHPWRNSARALSLLSATGRRGLQEAAGEILALALTAPLILPFLALLRLRLQEAETAFEAERASRIQRDGQKAPHGRSEIGTAVNRAVWGTAKGAIPRELALSAGTLDEIWQNPTNGVDLAIHHACELIRREAVSEVRLQTYLFDPESAAGKDLVATLAMKQQADPRFRVLAVVDRKGLDTALSRAGVRAMVAIARPWWSRRGHHAKAFVIDGRIGILGGDNIDSPREKDLMAVVRGPVVQAMLADFQDAWREAARPLSQDPLPEPPEPPPVHEEGIPMTVLTKRGVKAFWGEDYHDNDADQALLAALRAARREILIQTPSLNADAVIHELLAAAARGVSVRVCFPLKQHNRWATRVDAADNHSFVALWAQLPAVLQARIVLRDFSSNGRRREENHTKFLCVDRAWCYVGSQNMDNQSFAYSRELGIGLDDPETAERLAVEVFERDWKTSLPITPRWTERWIPYPLWYH